MSQPKPTINNIAMTNINSLQKTLGLINDQDYYKKMVDNMSGYSSLQKALDSINNQSNYKNMVDSMLGHSALQKALDVINNQDSYKKMLDSMIGGNQSSLQKTLDSINSQGYYKSMVDSMLGHSALHKALDAINNQDYYKKMIDSLLGHSSLQNTLNEISRADVFEQLFLNSSLKDMISDIAISQEQSNLSESALDSTQNETDGREISFEIKKLATSKNSSEFFEGLLKLPRYAQVLILFLIFNFALPVTQNVVANLITPYVQEVIGLSEKPNKELAKNISKLKLENVDLEQYRFVRIDHLILREHANSKSLMIDNLQFGQVVTVVAKEKNWMEISYTYPDGEAMHGWVFERYLEKFK